jgi:hypothetical protein
MLHEPALMLTISPSTDDEIALFMADVMSPLHVTLRVAPQEGEAKRIAAAPMAATADIKGSARLDM